MTSAGSCHRESDEQPVHFAIVCIVNALLWCNKQILAFVKRKK